LAERSYLALNFNGHLVHYAHDYPVSEEPYPGLVVHGPLRATWLVEGAGGIARLLQNPRNRLRAGARAGILNVKEPK
jgi:hydroxyacyl-ACP dehydratase HTD2-like protein with hotdog domain